MSAVLYFYGADLGSVDLTNGRIISGLAGALVLYVVVVGMGAVGWRMLLRAFGAAPARWTAERQVLISQIGKYAPGNIAHYLGRAAMTTSAGVSASVIGFALVAEAAAIVIGGILLVSALVVLSPDLLGRLARIVPDASRLIWPVVAGAAILLILSGVSVVSRPSGQSSHIPVVKLGGLFVTVLLYIAAFVVLGWSLNLIVGALAESNLPTSVAIAVFAVAWIAGLATPGAPGGLGVRESVLTLGLAPFVGGGTALTAAILYRAVSVLGDVIAFAIGTFLPNRVSAP